MLKRWNVLALLICVTEEQFSTLVKLTHELIEIVYKLLKCYLTKLVFLTDIIIY